MFVWILSLIFSLVWVFRTIFSRSAAGAPGDTATGRTGDWLGRQKDGWDRFKDGWNKWRGKDKEAEQLRDPTNAQELGAAVDRLRDSVSILQGHVSRLEQAVANAAHQNPGPRATISNVKAYAGQTTDSAILEFHEHFDVIGPSISGINNRYRNILTNEHYANLDNRYRERLAGVVEAYLRTIDILARILT